MANNDDGSKWAVSSDQFSTHFAYYHRITPPDTLLKGARAREFFLQTKLPPELLSQIWNLSDVDRDGALNPAEFFVAMMLVQHSLTGSTLPPTLPSQLQSIIQRSVNPQLPVADTNHLTKCKTAFKAFQSNIGVGVLGGDAARYIFSKSNLTKNQLFHIWKLSDMDRDGHLSFLEFTVAMHLIFVAKIGYILPIDVDPNTILPPSFYQVVQSVQAEANQLPPDSNPSHINTDPFSPPTTPIHPTHSSGNNNPFSSDEFFNLPARRFREGDFEDFTGDPFVGFEENSNDILQDDDNISNDITDGVPPPIPQKHQLNLLSTSNGHTSPSAGSSGSEPLSISREEHQHHHQQQQQQQQQQQVDETECHDYYILESPLQQHPPASTSMYNGRHGGTGQERRRVQQLANRNDSDTNTSSIVSKQNHKTVQPEFETSRSPISTVEDSPTTVVTGLSTQSENHELKSNEVSDDFTPSPTWYEEKDSSHEQTTPTSSLSQEPIIHDVIISRGSLKDESSSPGPSSSTSSPSISGRRRRKKYQEITISERTEPVLQVATAVDVIGSRETTPTPDKVEIKEMTPEDVAEELESLSRASRKFLRESKGKLEEQQRRNVPQQSLFGMEQYRAASMKGLTSTIEEMEGCSNQSDEMTKPVLQATDQDVTDERPPNILSQNGGPLLPLEDDQDLPVADDDVMSHLEDLEAEIMAALADDDFDLDDDDELEREESLSEREESLSTTPTSNSPITKGVRFRQQEDILQDMTPPALPMKSTAKFTSSYVSDRGRESTEAEVQPAVEVVKRVYPESAINSTVSQAAKRKSTTAEELMEDLDDILGEEMASFQEVFEQFQVKDKQAKERNKHEQAELQTMETKTKEDRTDVALAGSMDEVTRRRTEESHILQEQWEQEMKRIEEERLKALEQQEMDKERTIESDATLKSLDDELKTLIEHEEKAVKEAQIEKELRLKREKEEKERREKERLERLAREGPQQEEMTVDEWIKWMEAEKTKGMTPAQMEEYQRRKARYLVVAQEREEKRRRQEEEQKEKIRKMMMEDQRAYQTRTREVEAARIESEVLAAKNKEEQNRKVTEESKARVEKGKQMRAAMRQWEEEMSTPKARSALAARFEETVKARNDGKLSGRKDSKTTVMSSSASALEREEQRMLRRMSNGTRAEITQTKQENRKSLQ